jgi:hypothetical protein
VVVLQDIFDGVPDDLVRWIRINGWSIFTSVYFKRTLTFSSSFLAFSFKKYQSHGASAQVSIASFEIKISIPQRAYRLRSKIPLARITKECMKIHLISSETGTCV